MHKIDGAGHVDGQFVTEDAANGRPPTLVTADWLNAVQSELVAVLQAAGIAPDKANNAQLSAAIGVLLQRHKQESDPHPGYLRDADFEAWRAGITPKRAIIPATTDWCTLFSYATNTQICLLSSHNSHPNIYQIVCSIYPGSTRVVQPVVTSTGYNYTPSALTFRRLDVNGRVIIQAQPGWAFSKVVVILNYQQVREHITLLTEHITWS